MPYRHQITIPFQDIDAAGIVFFAHLFRYAHEAYERFMAHIGHSLVDVLEQGDYLLPLVHAEADYKAPLRLGQSITIELKVKSLGAGAFTLYFRFLSNDDQVLATAETGHVVVDKENGKPAVIPDALRTALYRYGGKTRHAGRP